VDALSVPKSVLLYYF